MQKGEQVTGWIEGLGPEQHWRMMVAALALLFCVGLLVGSLKANASEAQGPEQTTAVQRVELRP
jgi:hypothetical protein